MKQFLSNLSYFSGMALPPKVLGLVFVGNSKSLESNSSS